MLFNLGVRVQCHVNLVTLLCGAPDGGGIHAQLRAERVLRSRTRRTVGYSFRAAERPQVVISRARNTVVRRYTSTVFVHIRIICHIEIRDTYLGEKVPVPFNSILI
jgi:hypothetical protein